MPDRLAVFPLDLPGMVGQRADRRRQLAAHVGADGIAEAARLQPAQQLVLVGALSRADQDLRRRRAAAPPRRAPSRPPVAAAGGTLPSRNSSASTTSCSAQSATTG